MRLGAVLGLVGVMDVVGFVGCGGGGSSHPGNPSDSSTPTSSADASAGTGDAAGTGQGGDDAGNAMGSNQSDSSTPSSADASAGTGDAAGTGQGGHDAGDAMGSNQTAGVPLPCRIFKSPGGSIIFEWPQAADATSYGVVIDGTTVATTQGNVPFAVVPVQAFSSTDAGTSAVHTWSLNTTTASGITQGTSTQFELAEAVDGTTGAPLGGAGSGAIKFCPSSGQFAFEPLTPAGFVDYKVLPNTNFQLYTKRGTDVVSVPNLEAAHANGRYDDDAIFPIERATFPTTNGVTATLLAFAPYDRPDPTITTYPLAFYQFTLYNSQTTPVDVAVAFQLSTQQAPVLVDNLGMSAGGNTQMALYAMGAASSSAGDAGVDALTPCPCNVIASDAGGSALAVLPTVISVGNDTGFASNGVYNDAPSGTVNGVAVKVTLPPGGKTDVKFVLSWYEADNPGGYQYMNYGGSAQAFAQAGVADFDTLRDSAVEYTERFRASTVPDWILNETMDFTTWSNSSIYTQDGRYSEWEGDYVWFGQMDQGWHAFGSELWRIPDIVWGKNGASEMEFWARTMMVGDDLGQMSHDFTPAAGEPTSQRTCEWDAPGYHGWGGPNWVDLNCGFIFGVYEGFVATGDKARMDFYWPYVQKTANRLYEQASTLYSDPGFPFTFNGSGCTYDKGTQDCQLYNSGLAIPAFKIIADLAGIYGDTAMQTQFTTAYTTAIQSYQARWLVDPTTAIGANQEEAVAGLWMALHFKQNQPFTDAQISAVMSHLYNDFFHPLDMGMAAAGTQGQNEGWIPYLLGHLGGASIVTGNVAEWRAIQKDSYDRYFGNRSSVFDPDIYLVNEPLNANFVSNNFSSYSFYVSTPVVWHNYTSLIGFWYNAYTDELYVQPILPSTDDQWGTSMNHQLTNAFFVTPASYGSLDYLESGAGFANKDVVIRFDVPQNVSAIYLTDNFGTATPTATVDGTSVTVQRVGTGSYDGKLKLMWNGTVGPTGIHVVAEAK